MHTLNVTILMADLRLHICMHTLSVLPGGHTLDVKILMADLRLHICILSVLTGGQTTQTHTHACTHTSSQVDRMHIELNNRQSMRSELLTEARAYAKKATKEYEVLLGG